MNRSSSKLDGVDRGIALVLLVLSSGFIAVGLVAIALFFRERNAFEIRQRSPWLVMLTGFAFLALIAKIMINQSEGVFGISEDFYAVKTIEYFGVVCSTCCYGSRTIRLRVRSCEENRQVAPWLVPERPHVVASFLLGVAAMVEPLHYVTSHDEAATKEARFIDKADDQLWFISLAAKLIVILLTTVTWGLDDIFKLERELRVLVVVLVVQIVVEKVVKDSPLTVTRWIDGENLDFIGAVVMFSLSVIHPLRERFLYPMDSSDPDEIRAWKKRKMKATGRGHRMAKSWFGKDLDGGSLTFDHLDDVDHDNSGTVRMASPGPSPDVPLTYEKAISTPEVSAAFKLFSRKALCQESIFFLEEATMYENLGAEDGGGSSHGGDRKDEEEEGGRGDGGRGGRQGSDGLHEERFALLARIVREYIADGSPNEINISSRDKKNIFEVHKLGKDGFRELPAEEQRRVFVKAFLEIRFVLESNLMRKFTSTDEFKEALAADKANTAACRA